MNQSELDEQRRLAEELGIPFEECSLVPTANDRSLMTPANNNNFGLADDMRKPSPTLA